MKLFLGFVCLGNVTLAGLLPIAACAFGVSPPSVWRDALREVQLKQ
jgi:hypothetical protein